MSSSDNVEIRKHIVEIERHLQAIKQKMFVVDNVVGRTDLFASDDGKVIEGIFDGEAMVSGEGNVYPVSPNYASKSRLVVGDRLKLTIAPDGKFIYKQICPAERKRRVGTVEVFGDLPYIVIGDKRYRVLVASITYFKVKVGDRVTAVLPGDETVGWVAIENVLGAGEE
ncbi:MAG TPA: hypothetical protein PLX55_01095 [bacterium]|jgi:hypothetical protein|nr:hypothetical protein [bacterium]